MPQRRDEHAPQHPSGMSRTPGLILAAVTGVVGIGAIWAFSSFLRAPAAPPRASQSTANQSSDTGKASTTRPAPVDLSAPTARVTPGTGTRIQGSSGAVVQWADKNDPSRLAGEMRYATLEPLGDKRYNVTSPKGWMFLRDGGAVYLEAKGGNIFIADEQVSRRPDAGTLTGGVAIKVFKRKPDGSRPDPATDAPYAVTTMDTLSFDGTTGEISTPDAILATMDTATFSGRGLTIIFNELRDRVEYLEIREGDRLVVKATSSKPNAPATAAPAPSPASGDSPAVATKTQPTPANPAATAAAPTAAPVRTQYRAVFGSDVRLSQGTREIKSEVLEVFAVLLDGRFSPDAFGAKAQASAKPSIPAASDASGAGKTTSTTAPVTQTATPTDAAAAKSGGPLSKDQPSNDQADVILTWSGALVARTVDDSIAELVRDDVSMRFTSPLGGVVHMDDPATGAAGTAPVLNYFATRREVAMSAPAPEGVNLDLKSNGVVIGQSLALNLGTGVAHARGPGRIVGVIAAPTAAPAAATAAASPAPNTTPAPGAVLATTDVAKVDAPKVPQTISWSDQADFMFAMKDGKVTNQLQEAILSGTVQARGDGSALDAGWLRAVFAQADSTSRITLLEAREKVHASDAAGSTLTGENLEIAFGVSPAGQAVPERVLARTAARALRTGPTGQDLIEGGVIDARLGVDAKGKSEVRQLTARDAAHVQSADGVDARAHTIVFEVPTQKAKLTGRGNDFATATKDSTTISGPVVEVDGVARTIGVPGPGTLTHTQMALKDGPKDAFIPRVEARWSSAMTFDDRKGTANLAGAVNAIWMPDAVTTDKVTGESIDLTLTPAPAEQPSATSAPAKPGNAPPREVLRAVAKGAGATLASVESRRVVSAADRTLQSLTYVQGATIEADNTAQTFTVPGAGKLLSVDRSQPAANAPASTDPFANSRGSGDALFTWTESMTAYRAQDRAQMRGDVQVVHLRSGDTAPTELRSRDLTATLRQSGAPSTSAATSITATGASLSQLIATGNVWARSSTKREMTSDRMVYDAVQGLMVLTADNDRDVTVFDPAARAPLTSKAIEWDLKKDRVRIVAPGSISTGR